jgi:hypothetical protein
VAAIRVQTVTLTVEGGVGGECRVFNWPDKTSTGMVEGTDGPNEVSEAACKQCPDKLGKSPVNSESLSINDISFRIL